MIPTVKGFSIVNEAEVNFFFLEFSCFFYDSMDVDNLIPGSSVFSKFGLSVHVLLKPNLENFEHYSASVWNDYNCVVLNILWHYLSLVLECSRHWVGFSFCYFIEIILRFSAKLGESTEISHIHPAPHIYSLSYYQNPHQHNTFVITGEHTLTHHNHLKSTVYNIHSWYCTFCGFDKCIMICPLL